MNVNSLRAVYRIDRVHLLNNEDVEYTLHVYIWMSPDARQFFSSVERSFFAEVSILSEGGEVAAERIWSEEESLECCGLLYDSEAEALACTLKAIELRFE